MNFVQQLEECLRDLASVARKKHPGVKEASERATLKLRLLKNQYVSQVRKANKQQQQQQQQQASRARRGKRKNDRSSHNDDDDDNSDSSDSSNSSNDGKHPTTRLFQSSDLLHPFLLATNYPNASQPMLDVSIKAMRILMEGDAIVPTDGLNLVRVWMIQAQCIVSHYQKQYAKEIQQKQQQQQRLYHGGGGGEGASSSSVDGGSTSASATAKAHAASSTTVSSTSSWLFGWGSSSTSTAAAAADASGGGSSDTAAVDQQAPNSGNHNIMKATTTTTNPLQLAAASVVSSSTGQAGTASSRHTPAQMEKLALDILSMLLQLLELLTRSYAPTMTTDLWTSSAALASLWLHYLPTRHTVQQAAQSTVSQVLTLMYQETSSCTSTMKILGTKTWEDLLILSAAGDNTIKNNALTGAFAQCKPSSVAAAAQGRGGGTPSVPPSPEFALKLMVRIWKEHLCCTKSSDDDNNKSKVVVVMITEPLLTMTFSTTVRHLEQMASRSKQRYVSLEKSLRISQWTLCLIQTQAVSYPTECRELFTRLVKLIALATETCRAHHDFEDGYVYTHEEAVTTLAMLQASTGSMPGASSDGHEQQQQPRGIKEKTPSSLANHPHSQQHLSTLVPSIIMWKAAMALEAVYHILEGSPHEVVATFFLSDVKAVSTLAEALSDFATICASCHDHMLQLVEFCFANDSTDGIMSENGDLTSVTSKIIPTTFHKAEQLVSSGIYLDDETLVSKGTEKGSASSLTGHGPLGEALWIAFIGALRITKSISQIPDEGGDGPKGVLLDETFAPSLAVLQHYLKRFVGCNDLVQLALRGYTYIADVCLPLSDCTLPRKALLTSLCKLSLPSWGKFDHASQLQDHHVRALLALIRIVHTHHDSITTEWDMILWTFEELSVLPIASPLLNDVAYHGSLAVAAVYDRCLGFSTCFSQEALLHMARALMEISRVSTENRAVVGDSDTVLPQPSVATAADDSASQDGRGTISEKLMNIGVKAIYGSKGGIEAEGEKSDSNIAERTKSCYYEDYHRDFVRRITSSKCTVRVSSLGRVPFVLALLADVAMANSFRYKECGEVITKELSELAALSPAIRPLTMDLISLLILSHLSKDRSFPVPFIGPGRIVFENPMQSQLWAVESAEDASASAPAEDISQVELLSPLCDSIRTATKADVAESALGALITILESAGHDLCGDVWCAIIDAVTSLSGDPAYKPDRSSSEWSRCCLSAFRCLKFIVDDFLGQLPPTPEGATMTTAQASLLNCCSSFGISHHDVNTSLTAIGLFWTIADRDSSKDAIDSALAKLAEFTSDDRPEVRNAAVNTLFSCIVGKGARFTASQWASCISYTIFGVYDLVSVKAGMGSQPTSDADGQDVSDRGSSRYRVSMHHSRDSSSKQWIATQVLVLQGLIRVLRNFFPSILESADYHAEQASDDDVPWFQDAWVRILDFAFETASQGTGRDSLDIRSVGVELLVVCCQVSSSSGIEAALTKARVGTNMEVVNGALRSVREARVTKQASTRTRSASTERFRELLFLEAFESLESYQEHIEKASNSKEAEADDARIQILHKFCTGLTRLYECCKDKEFQVDNGSRSLQPFTPTNSQVGETDELEPRFVTIVAAINKASQGDPKSRYLNQAQRCGLDLIKGMASDGSSEACLYLVNLAGASFFAPADPADKEEGDYSDDTEETPAFPLIKFEASEAISLAVSSELLSDECRLLVVYKILCTYLAAQEHDQSNNSKRKWFLKRLAGVIPIGLQAAAQLASQTEDNERKVAVDMLWAELFVCLSYMLAPVPLAKDLVKISCVSELLAIVNAAIDNVESGVSADKLSSCLAFGASKTDEVAKTHESFAKTDHDDEMRKKSKKYRDGVMKLFNVCFSGACSLQPDDDTLRSIARCALNDAYNAAVEDSTSDGNNGGDQQHTCFEATVMICDALTQNDNTETLVTSLFPLLCQLITSDNAKLRIAVAKVLTSGSDIDRVLRAAQKRYEDAEGRATKAEAKVKELESVIESLQGTINSLQRDAGN